MQIEFLLKTLGDVIEKASEDEVKNIVRDFTAILHHRTDLESLERYRIIIEGLVLEVDRELLALDTGSVPARDDSEELASRVGISYLTALRSALENAISFCEL
jgi:hypothetical protein